MYRKFRFVVSVKRRICELWHNDLFLGRDEERSPTRKRGRYDEGPESLRGSSSGSDDKKYASDPDLHHRYEEAN